MSLSERIRSWKVTRIKIKQNKTKENKTKVIDTGNWITSRNRSFISKLHLPSNLVFHLIAAITVRISTVRQMKKIKFCPRTEEFI